MRIERVDDKTVKCFLSNEELEQYEIDYKDFVTRSEKAKEIVQEIIAQAQEEFGYKPPRFAFDLQIMMVPDQGLVLTFSDKDPDVKDGDQLIECLKEMKKILQQGKEKLENKNQIPPQTQNQASSDGVNENKQSGQKESDKQEVKRPDFAVFVFDSLHDVMSYIAILPANLKVESALYGMEDAYFLYIHKNHASYERFSRACIQAMEFATLYTADESRILQLKEHGNCLIEEKAIRKLRS